MFKKTCIFLLIAASLIIAGCSKEQVMDGPDMVGTPEYIQIDQETAKEMMERDDGHIVIDVRRQDEFDSGHIPGAVCIPNESIETTPPVQLSDPDQVILVYCRSGRRSKEAAQKLADMGYRNVYEFGGIIDWTGEIVTESQTENKTEEIDQVAVLVIRTNDTTFYADLEDNSSAKAFIEKLRNEEVIIDLHDYGNFEKVGPLPWDLPRNDETITTQPGDVILYQGSQITIYYDENTWDFTRIAKIPDITKDELLEAFGDGNVSVTFSIEWRE
ncbi:MAG: cyclophilin-like fold protein [Lachnospiraceae bacterium]|nr:cyclophilin-like fold protein [Lachnospiraceae bacterium]